VCFRPPARRAHLLVLLLLPGVVAAAHLAIHVVAIHVCI
jgi:hypothetical protein